MLVKLLRSSLPLKKTGLQVTGMLILPLHKQHRSAENLGGVLLRDRIENSVYTFHMRDELPCKVGLKYSLMLNMRRTLRIIPMMRFDLIRLFDEKLDKLLLIFLKEEAIKGFELFLFILGSKSKLEADNTSCNKWKERLQNYLQQRNKLRDGIIAIDDVVDILETESIDIHVLNVLRHSSSLDGVQPTVKDALTKAYNKDSKSHVIHDAAWEGGDAAGHSGYTIIEADYIGYVGLCLILDLDYDYKRLEIWVASNLKGKFLGSSIQLYLVGVLTLMFEDGATFQPSK
ncbi:hypothetical protein Tco_0209881, partial [Tanacetum coccineum]